MTILKRYSEQTLNDVLAKAGIEERIFSPSTAGITASVFFACTKEASGASSSCSPDFVVKVHTDLLEKSNLDEHNERIALGESVRKTQKRLGEKEFTLPKMIKNPKGGYLFTVESDRRSAQICQFVKGDTPNLKDSAHAKRIGAALAAFHMAHTHKVSYGSVSTQKLVELYIKEINERLSPELLCAIENADSEEIRARKAFLVSAVSSVNENKEKLKENVKGIVFFLNIS